MLTKSMLHFAKHLQVDTSIKTGTNQMVKLTSSVDPELLPSKITSAGSALFVG